MTNFGYHTLEGFLPRKWFQFADDPAAVTSLEGENQILLNLFSKWCRWSEMTIKASKCHSFGICKTGTTSTQYKPKLYLDNALVPPVKLDDCFTYLSLNFDFKMSDDKHKSESIGTITDQIEITDKLPLYPKNKLKLYHHEIPVNGTSNIITRAKCKFGLGKVLPSARHIQCRLTYRNKIRKSSNHNIREIHKSTWNINIQ